MIDRVGVGVGVGGGGEVVGGLPAAPLLATWPPSPLGVVVELRDEDPKTVTCGTGGAKVFFFVVAPTAPPMIAAKMTIATMTSIIMPFLVR